MTSGIASRMKDFVTVCQAKSHKEQAIFFLNAYWGEYSDEKENCWKWVEMMNELDSQGEEGIRLDEFQV